MSTQQRTCVVITCDQCQDTYGDADNGAAAWHFPTLAEAQASIDAENLDEDDTHWVINNDGTALCDDCRRAKICAANGHQWHTHPEYTCQNGEVLPAFTLCTTCNRIRRPDKEIPAA